VFSFGCLLRFYKGNWNGSELPVQDDKKVVEEFESLWKKNNSKAVVSKVLSKKEFWDQDLTQIPNLAMQLEDILDFLATGNIESAFNSYINKYDY
jgi:tagaturonate reductase